MSHNINYNHLVKYLSSARIQAISSSFGGNLTIKQSFGIFFWEQQVASNIYPIIQLIEVSLRNSMNQNLQRRFGQNWWDTLNSTDNCSFSQNCYCTKCNLKKSIQKAEKRFKKEYRRSTNNNFTGTVSIDDIISQTELSTWEQLLTINLYAPNNQQNTTYLYPISLNGIFKGIPSIYPNSTGNSRQILSNIKTLVYNVRLLRNRISHHDRLWTKSNLSGDFNQRKRDIIDSISKKLDDIKNLLLLISPELLKMIENWGLFNNVHEILSIDTLERYLDEEFFKFSSKLEQDMFLVFLSEYKVKSYSISKDIIDKTLHKIRG